MKIFILLVVLTFLANIPEAHALFGHVAQEHERRVETEQKLVEQQHFVTQQQETNGKLETVIHFLSAGVVVALLIGAAIGSKTRRDHAK